MQRIYERCFTFTIPREKVYRVLGKPFLNIPTSRYINHPKNCHLDGAPDELRLDSADALTYVTAGGVVDVELKWLVETDRYWRVKYHVILEPSGPPVKDGLINVPVNIRGFEDTGTGTAVEFETSVVTDPDSEYA